MRHSLKLASLAAAMLFVAPGCYEEPAEDTVRTAEPDADRAAAPESGATSTYGKAKERAENVVDDINERQKNLIDDMDNNQ